MPEKPENILHKGNEKNNKNLNSRKRPLSKNRIVKEKEEKKSRNSTTKRNTSTRITNSTVKKSLPKNSSNIKSTTKKVTSKALKVIEKKKLDEKETSLLNKDLTKKFNVSEYYDLPRSYHKTVVKILAQTPNTLFVYWDISDDDRKKFIEQYGKNLFIDTKPVLIVKNLTMNYTFEIDINDFANSWYFHVNDSKCEYSIELGRRPINNNIHIPDNYVYVSSSNTIESPNDHVLLERLPNTIYFKNVKTNHISSININRRKNLIGNFGTYVDVQSFYREAYKGENFKNSNRLMGNSSSVFK